MKRLYNKREDLRIDNIIIFYFWVLYVVVAVIYSIIKEPAWTEIGFVSVLSIIAEIITFLRWYPVEIAHKQAIERGKMYEGKIRIQTKWEKKEWQRHPHWSYSLMITCNVDGNLVAWEEEYWDNPAEYVPGSRRCKVYFYKNKYYLQYFYRQSKPEKVPEGVHKLENNLEYSIQDIESLNREELKKASMERMSRSGMHMKTAIIVPPVYFLYLKQPPLKIMIVEIRVKSEEVYDDIAFLLRERIANYVHSLESDAATNDDMLKDGVKNLVKDIIFLEYEKILVEEVLVVIR